MWINEQRIFSNVLNACLQIHNYTNRTLNSRCIFAIIVQDVFICKINVTQTKMSKSKQLQYVFMNTLKNILYTREPITFIVMLIKSVVVHSKWKWLYSKIIREMKSNKKMIINYQIKWLHPNHLINGIQISAKYSHPGYFIHCRGIYKCYTYCMYMLPMHDIGGLSIVFFYTVWHIKWASNNRWFNEEAIFN